MTKSQCVRLWRNVRVKDTPGCAGCPMYQDGEQPFVPDEIVPTAPTFVLGQNPGVDEARSGRPFVGKTGEDLIRVYFPLAGLERGVNVSIGNAVRCRWQGTNELPKGKVLEDVIAHCTRAHLRIPSGTRLVVAQGAVAAKALGCPGNITDWRGHTWEYTA